MGGGATRMYLKYQHFIRHFVCSVLLLLIVIQLPKFALSENDKIAVTIGYNPIRISLPLLVAHHEGYLAQEGLDVQLERYETPQPMMESLGAGRISVAGYVAMPIVYATVGRAKVGVVTTTAILEDKDHQFAYLLVRSDDTSPRKVTDLKGKRVGILPTVAFQKWFSALLSANGMKESDLSVVPVNPSLLVSGLQTGQFDAIYTPDPMGTVALASGKVRQISEGKVRLWEIFSDPYLVGTFVMRRDFVDSNPATAQKIKQALNKAILFIRSHQSESKTILATFLDPSQRTLSESFPDTLCSTSEETKGDEFNTIQRDMTKLGLEFDSSLIDYTTLR